jgi:hypothetical protein
MTLLSKIETKNNFFFKTELISSWKNRSENKANQSAIQYQALSPRELPFIECQKLKSKPTHFFKQKSRD